MKQILCIISLVFMAASCGPSRHSIHVEMRHPSKSGIEFVSKNVAVVHMENDNRISNLLAEGIPTDSHIPWSRITVQEKALSVFTGCV